MARTASRGRGFWVGVIARHQASELSVAAFCRQESLSDKTFYLWRRRLKSDKEAKSLAVEDFTELVVDPPIGSGLKVSVTLANGLRLSITEIASDDQLIGILSALQASR